MPKKSKKRTRNVIAQLDAQMKHWQSQPHVGCIPRDPLSVEEYRQPQRFAYRLAKGMSMLNGSEK